jgi:hypothetical protein
MIVTPATIILIGLGFIPRWHWKKERWGETNRYNIRLAAAFWTFTFVKEGTHSCEWTLQFVLIQRLNIIIWYLAKFYLNGNLLPTEKQHQ